MIYGGKRSLARPKERFSIKHVAFAKNNYGTRFSEPVNAVLLIVYSGQNNTTCVFNSKHPVVGFQLYNAVFSLIFDHGWKARKVPIENQIIILFMRESNRGEVRACVGRYSCSKWLDWHISVPKPFCNPQLFGT